MIATTKVDSKKKSEPCREVFISGSAGTNPAIVVS